ncbi:MAG: DUF2281 domain-containing protein [Nostoc sp. NMS1]|uniref:DUF2281 domain-containing protein n=1 Tax=unclassified Nostoc TaxID=2593658 RepID=UPI0025EC19C4|nr:MULTISPECIES: DUF2281 domain-containing protein [unclassified Nostoc]MBN3909357.1 DUF2281 domain-containing protein [Nostoc sp. NMS1]MBN3993440.1 DUF2281 domain-containing protein [Nostoc sp. NMS2]
MTIRETAIAKLQQLSEPLLQEVTDFIDFVIQKHQVKNADSQPDETLVEKWSQWFEAVDSLEVSPPEPVSNYQQLLLNKYRQQGLEL